MADDSQLLAVLESLRERGALGESSLTNAVAHADSFVAAVPAGCQELLDLGSGGGLPGLVIAVRLPHVRVTLTDRRERRMDLLRHACAKLDLGDRVVLRTADVRRLALEAPMRGKFDVVTARAFGEPLLTLECAAPFLRAGGAVIISEPPPNPGADPEVRWPTERLVHFGFSIDPVPRRHVRRFMHT